MHIDVMTSEDAVIPSYANIGDAGLDITSIDDAVLAPHERKLIHTGVKVAIPNGFVGLLTPRSGLALKRGLSIVNTPGVIDSGYRGELGVIALNTNDKEEITISKGERIAQLVIIPFVSCDVRIVDSFEETQRGEGGFGSSGTM